MITFFTTAKKFDGDTKNSQLNALRSWLILDPNIEVIVFEAPQGIDLGTVDKRIHIDPSPLSVNGIPRIDYMFQYVSAKAKNPYCCFINCDIILTAALITVVREKLSKLKEKFLAVGQRWDFENKMGEWQFTEQWESRYLENIEKKLHPPAGSDYFLFPKGQYPQSSIPPLIVGRPGWDLWMIYNARKRRLKTIDLSNLFLLYHQNHDYSHKKKQFANNLEEPEAISNLSYLPETGKYEFTLLACDYTYTANGKLVQNFARWMMERYLRISSALGRTRGISRLKYRSAQVFHTLLGLK